MEKRKFRRVVFHSEAVIKSKGFLIRGNIKDVSLSGLFVETTDRMPDENVDITILLSGRSSELFLNMKGRIVREESDGLAIEFSTMDLDSFIQLKGVVAHISGAEDSVVQEFMDYMKFDEHKEI